MRLLNEFNVLKNESNLKLTEKNGKTYIFDPIRKRSLLLQPEEMVRQSLIHFIILNNIYPKNLIQVEKTIDAFGKRRRFDLLVYKNALTPFLVVECKSPQIPILQKHGDQVFAYREILQSTYVLITNGLTHICGKISPDKLDVQFIDYFPELNG